MSDFDEALERLLTDPGFARALATDPPAALAGYQLSDAEIAVLTTQVAEESGGQRTVEARTSQSSLAAMLSPLTPGGGLSGFGAAPAAEHGFGAAPATDQGLGSAPEDGLRGSAARQGLGTAPESGRGGGTSLDGFGPRADVPQPEVPQGYRTRVDVDGDGVWDAHTLHATADGGVEIHVDRDGDGRVDFIGHDVNADGRVDWAEYDRDGDGRFETRMYDDDGDGWMDRTEVDK